MSIKLSEDLVLYNVETLSELLGVSTRTIRRLFRAGDLKGTKLARKWYITEADLRAYFGQAETEAKQEETSGR